MQSGPRRVAVWLQVVDEIITDGFDVLTILHVKTDIIGILLRQQRFGVERHLAIVQCQLQISLCADGPYLSHFLRKNLVATIVVCSRIGVCKIIITVVNHCIIITRTIIPILIRHFEVG